MKKFFEILYDHWLVGVSIFGLGALSWIKSNFSSFENYSVKLWIVLLVVFLMLLLWSSISNFFKKSKLVEVPIVLEKPKTKIQDYGAKELFSVKWNIWLGCTDEFSYRRIWADGPFCPKCMYELDNMTDFWFCVSL